MGRNLLRHAGTGSRGGGPSAEAGGSKGGLLFWGRDSFRRGGGPARLCFPRAWGRDLGRLWAGSGRGQDGARARRRAGRSLVSVLPPGASSRPWLHAAGAGGTGRHGLGSGRLPPGAPRVGAAHPWGWMGARGGLRTLSGGVGAQLGQSWRGTRQETGGVHSRGQCTEADGGPWGEAP